MFDHYPTLYSRNDSKTTYRDLRVFDFFLGMFMLGFTPLTSTFTPLFLLLFFFFFFFFILDSTFISNSLSDITYEERVGL